MVQAHRNREHELRTKIEARLETNMADVGVTVRKRDTRWIFELMHEGRVIARGTPNTWSPDRATLERNVERWFNL